MYSISITTFNRERKGRKNYFSEAWFSFVKAGILTNPLIRSIDIFVGHEPDEWTQEVMPIHNKVNVHYLDKDSDHQANIYAVMRHAVSDMSTAYHLYLEDDIIVRDDYIETAFYDVLEFQLNVGNIEKTSVFLDFKCTQTNKYTDGYREEALNTFTCVMFFKLTIQRFLTKHPVDYPPGVALDCIFGRAVLQPTYTKVPGLFSHIGLESAAHKRCFKQEIGNKHDL